MASKARAAESRPRLLRLVDAIPHCEPPITAVRRAGANRNGAAKPGRKPPRPFTPKQIGEAFVALRREMNDVALMAGTGVEPRTSEALDAAVTAYLEETDPQGWVRSSLAYAAARLALGHEFSVVAEPSLLGVDLKLSRALAAAIGRKYPTQIGKAFALYRIIAKGLADVPQRRAPSGELKRLLEWRLSQFTD